MKEKTIDTYTMFGKEIKQAREVLKRYEYDDES